MFADSRSTCPYIHEQSGTANLSGDTVFEFTRNKGDLSAMTISGLCSMCLRARHVENLSSGHARIDFEISVAEGGVGRAWYFSLSSYCITSSGRWGSFYKRDLGSTQSGKVGIGKEAKRIASRAWAARVDRIYNK